MFTFCRLGLCQKENRRNAIPVPSVLLETLTHRLSSRDGAWDASDDSAGVSVAAHDFQVFNTTELTTVDREGWMKEKTKGSLLVTQPLLISLQVLGQSNPLPSGFTWPNLAPLLGLREPRSEQLFTSNILTPNHMRNRSGLGKSAFLSAHVLVSRRSGDIIRFAFPREELFFGPLSSHRCSKTSGEVVMLAKRASMWRTARFVNRATKLCAMAEAYTSCSGKEPGTKTAREMN